MTGMTFGEAEFLVKVLMKYQSESEVELDYKVSLLEELESFLEKEE